MRQDLRFAVRQLARQRSFAAIVVVTLALGIGAATTCFSVLNAVALRPIPFPDPDGLLAIRAEETRGSGQARLTSAAVRALQQMPGLWSGSAAYVSGTRSVTAGDAAVERVAAAEVSGDLFVTLGVPVSIGRPLTAADAGARVAVISHDERTRLFGSNADVLGRTLTVDGDPYVIVGVAAPRFGFPQDARVWLPLAGTPAQPVDVVARVQAGVSPSRIDAALRAASSDLLAGAPLDARAGWVVTARPLRQIMLGTKQRDAARFVLTAAGLVLLIACANLAGLLTAQFGGRAHEIALRSAIGARRRRIVRQLMTESAVLALAGGALGVLLAQWGVALFGAALGTPQGAGWVEWSVDGRVLAFALLTSTATAFLFGLLPAVGASRVDLRSALQEDRAIAGSRPGARRLRSLLVASQVALSICLIAGAASIVASAVRFEEVDPGFDRAGLLTLKVALTGRAYEHPAARLAYADAAVRRLRALPGVSAAAAASHVPLADRDVPSTGFVPEGMDVKGAGPRGTVRGVDAGYFAAMGIPIRRGRAFRESESHDGRGHAIVINDTMARRYWPDGDPIGRRVRLGGAPETGDWYEVIGVATDVAQRNLPAVPENQIYLPIAAARDLTLVVRSTADATSIASDAREAVRTIDASLAITAQSMTTTFRWYVEDRRMQGVVLGGIGAVGVLVAALGIYGIVSLMVTQRRREFAIRRALGASAASVMRLVVGRGLALSAAGAAAGLLLAVTLTAFLSSIFIGVRAFDLPVLAGSAALLSGVAAAASWWPARRATAIDPMIALKQ